MKALYIVVVLAVIAGGGWLIASRLRMPENTGATQSPTRATNGVEVVQTDVRAGATSKLPAGFPKDIPVETQNVTESYKAVYAERGVTQYTVSYTSAKSRDAVWDSYNTFMKDAGYSIDTAATSKSLGQLSGEKASDSLSVGVSSHGGLTLVQLNYLDR